MDTQYCNNCHEGCTLAEPKCYVGERLAELARQEKKKVEKGPGVNANINMTI